MTTLDYIKDVQIYQNKNGYRFSVDALLLYSFIRLQRVKRIADLGAGSGIIGLLLAKKYKNAGVCLVELQESLVKLAEQNIVINNLADSVKVLKADIKDLCRQLSEIYILQSQTRMQETSCECLLPESFDLVVSNPPFRKTETGIISYGDEKAIARHEIMLSLKDIIKTSSHLLKYHGRLCIIHLPERLAEILQTMSENALEPKRLRFIYSTISSQAKMLLIEAVKGGRAGLKIEKPLFIYNEDGGYTREMREIYGY